jgi:hypothetical protein
MTTLEVSAYALDRTLKGFAEWPDTDAVVVVNGFTKGATRDLTLTGENQLPAIVTFARGDIARLIWSREKVASTVTVAIAGGTVGTTVLKPGPEVAPDWGRLTDGSPIIVAGPLSDVPGVGRVLEPHFVYTLAPDGTVTSLLESGSNDPYPKFTLAEMESALKARK